MYIVFSYHVIVYTMFTLWISVCRQDSQTSRSWPTHVSSLVLVQPVTCIRSSVRSYYHSFSFSSLVNYIHTGVCLSLVCSWGKVCCYVKSCLLLVITSLILHSTSQFVAVVMCITRASLFCLILSINMERAECGY